MFCKYGILRDLSLGRFETFWLAGESRSRQAKSRSLYKNADVPRVCDSLLEIARMRSPGAGVWNVRYSIPQPRPKLVFVRMAIFLKGITVVHRHQTIVVYDLCQELYEQMCTPKLRNPPNAGASIVDVDDLYVPPRKRRPRKPRALKDKPDDDQDVQDIDIAEGPQEPYAHSMVEFNAVVPQFLLEEGFGAGECTMDDLNSLVETVLLNSPSGLLRERDSTAARKRSSSEPAQWDSSTKIRVVDTTGVPVVEPIESVPVPETPENVPVVGSTVNGNAANEAVITGSSTSISLQSRPEKKKRALRAPRRRRLRKEQTVFVRSVDNMHRYSVDPVYRRKLLRTKVWGEEMVRKPVVSMTELLNRPIMRMVDKEFELHFAFIFGVWDDGPADQLRAKRLSSRENTPESANESGSGLLAGSTGPGSGGPVNSGPIPQWSPHDSMPGAYDLMEELQDMMEEASIDSLHGGTPRKRRRVDTDGETNSTIVSPGRQWDKTLLKDRISLLWDTHGSPITFYDVCPKQKTSAKIAAKVFAALLDLDKKKVVILDQDAPHMLAPIRIYRPF